ncbi:MAG: hypothetical protein K5989_08520 [Lachnospiraceae bacterium]|nr:hypothetical protein [Lachnospiraceae bacterium]
MKMNEINLKSGGGTEKYLRPELEIIELSGENVIVTSGSSSDGPSVPFWGGEGG